MKLLTPKQEKFCIEYIKLNNATKAYKRAYNTTNMKASTINRKAVEVLANGNVRARVNELREKTENETIIDITRRKQILSDIIRTGEPKEILKAIDLLNKMDGTYTKKHEYTAEIITYKSSLKDFYQEIK